MRTSPHLPEAKSEGSLKGQVNQVSEYANKIQPNSPWGKKNKKKKQPDSVTGILTSSTRVRPKSFIVSF